KGAPILAHLRQAEERVGDARLGKSLGPQQAAVAAAAGRTGSIRIVATVGQAVVEPERKATADDLRLREMDERRVDAKSVALHAGARRDGRERLERADERRTTVGVPRVVERIDTDHE